MSLRLVGIRSAFFTHDMTIFSQEHVEVWPSSIAAFVHVITSHEHLWRKNWRLLSILYLESCLHNLCEWYRVARTAVTLVSELWGKVVSVEIPPVKRFWKFAVWNFICWFVFLLETLGFIESGNEFRRFFVKRFGFNHWLCKVVVFASGLGETYWPVLCLVAVGSVLGMCFLVFAGVCLPSEICVVDCWNHEVHLIAWLVL